MWLSSVVLPVEILSSFKSILDCFQNSENLCQWNVMPVFLLVLCSIFFNLHWRYDKSTLEEREEKSIEGKMQKFADNMVIPADGKYVFEMCIYWWYTLQTQPYEALEEGIK